VGVRVSFALAAVTAAAGAAWMLPIHGARGALTMAASTLAGGGLAAALVVVGARWLAPGPDGERRRGILPALGLANLLTLFRVVLIAPVVVLLIEGEHHAALAVYALLVFTDVADGVVARARREQGEFGVFMDPVADIASTYAVFTVFVVDKLVPEWLYLILTVRYVMLGAGSLGFYLATGPLEFRATVPGKVVGVIQALGAGVLMASAGGVGLSAAAREVLFASLGLGFASIVVSQAVLGWTRLRRARRAM
jgi:cardiolipin synthase